jgi:hypothetical protein
MTPAERFIEHRTGYVNKKGHKLSANIVLKYGAYYVRVYRAYQSESDDEGRGFDNGRKTCIGPEEARLCSLVQLIDEQMHARRIETISCRCGFNF